jgi:hypothetical protein
MRYAGDGGAGAQGMVKIITVHGTNAGAQSDSGDQWWQTGSAFQRRMQELIAEKLDFEPFHWSGANSEVERRKAGAALDKKLRQEAEPAIVLGHSHGGSVAIHALYHAHVRRPWRALLRREKGADPFPNLRFLGTIGTPMIRFQQTWFWPNRFNLAGQMLLFYAVTLTIVTISIALNYYSFSEASYAALIVSPVYAPLLGSPFDGASIAGLVSNRSPLWARPTVDAIFGAVPTWTGLIAFILFLMIAAFNWRSARRAKIFARNGIAGAAGGRVAAFNHRLDEAVAGLKASLLTATNLANRRKIVRLLLVPMALSLLVLSTVQEFADYADSTFGSYVELNENDISVSEYGEPLLRGRVLPSASGIGARISQTREELTDLKLLATSIATRKAYLKEDYVVMDVGVAVQMATPDALADYVENLTDTAPATWVTPEPARLGSDQVPLLIGAFYMTDQARDALAAKIRSWRREDFAGPARSISVHWMKEDDGPLEDFRLPRSDAPPSALTRRFQAVVWQGVDSDGNRTFVQAAEDYLYDHSPNNYLLTYFTASQIRSYLSDYYRISKDPKRVSRSPAKPEARLSPRFVHPALSGGDPLLFLSNSFAAIQWSCTRSAAADRLNDLIKIDALPYEFDFGSASRWCAQIVGADLNVVDMLTLLIGWAQGLVYGGVSSFGDWLEKAFNCSEDECGLDDLRTSGPFQTLLLLPVSLSLAWLFASILGWLIAPRLSRAFDRLWKNQVFGNDGRGEFAVAVAPGLDFQQTEIGTLPAAVEDDISSYTEQSSVAALHKLRAAISSAAVRGRSPLLADFAETLTWKELIHTSYFDVEAFRVHLAQALSEKAGLTLAANPPPPRDEDRAYSSAAMGA